MCHKKEVGFLALKIDKSSVSGLILLLFLVGCGTKQGPIKTDDSRVLLPENTYYLEEEFPEDDEAVVLLPTPKNKKFVVTPVVQSLLDKSKNKYLLAEFEAAASFLERGINISPNNPLLWQRLAVVRFKQRNYKQAKQLAVKSNVLVEGDNTLRAINEKIIRQANQFLAP